MTKKVYMQPAMNVVVISRRTDIVTASDVTTNIYGLSYDDNGTYLFYAW